MSRFSTSRNPWVEIERNIKAGVYNPTEEGEIKALIEKGGKTPETLKKIEEVELWHMAKKPRRQINDFGGAKGLPKLKAELRDLEKYKQLHESNRSASHPEYVPSIYRSKPYLLQAIKKKEEAIKKAESKKGGRKTRRSSRRGTRRN